jgi:hypothetical protein
MGKDERDIGTGKKKGDRVTARGYDQLAPDDEEPTARAPAVRGRGPLPGDPKAAITPQPAPVKEDTTVDDDLGQPAADATAMTLPPFVEVELVYERGPAMIEHQHWRALEIWTRNRVYGVDWGMSCIEVIDRETNKADPKHPLLGARLAGGQSREEGTMELTYPCPRPGCEAVFEHKSKRGSFSHTSTVLRVVLRLRVVTVVPETANHKWKELTGAHKLPTR